MKAVSVIITLTFLLGAMCVSLFHMSTDMDMVGGVSNCPFMLHGEALCSMNLTDHIRAWQSAFQAFAPVVVLSVASALATAVIIVVAPHILLPRYKPTPTVQRILRERTYSFSYRPLQELFSSGILHPRVFG